MLCHGNDPERWILLRVASYSPKDAGAPIPSTYERDSVYFSCCCDKIPHAGFFSAVVLNTMTSAAYKRKILFGLVFQRVEKNTPIQCQMVSPRNIHTGSIMRTEQAIFRNIYVGTHTYMHAITIRIKRGHGFAGESKGIYGGMESWMEERKTKNAVIKL